MTVERRSQSNLSKDEILQAARYIWPEAELDSHTTAEDLSHYAEISVNQPELIDSEEMQGISRHLLFCDQCLGEFLLLTESLRVPVEVSDQEFEVDLAFLQRPKSLWAEYGENLWRLAETIRIEVTQASLRVRSLADWIVWGPLAPVSVTARSVDADSEVVEGFAPDSIPLGQPGELRIPWPGKELTVRLVLTGTSRGTHLVVRGVETQDKLLPDMPKALLYGKPKDKLRRPLIRHDGLIDFQVLRSGNYELHLTLGDDTISLPIQVS